MKIRTEKGRQIGIYTAVVLLALLLVGGAVTGGIIVGMKIVQQEEKIVEQPERVEEIETGHVEEVGEAYKQEEVSVTGQQTSSTSGVGQPKEGQQGQSVAAAKQGPVRQEAEQPKPEPVRQEQQVQEVASKGDIRKITTASEEHILPILSRVSVPVEVHAAGFQPNMWDIKTINDIDGELLHTAEITVQPRADGQSIFRITTGGDKKIDAVWYSASMRPGVTALSRRYTPQGHHLETTEELNQRIADAALQPGQYGLKISYSPNQNGPWESQVEYFHSSKKSNWFIFPAEMRNKHTTIFVKVEKIGWTEKTEFGSLSLNVGELNRRVYRFHDES